MSIIEVAALIFVVLILVNESFIVTAVAIVVVSILFDWLKR